MTTQTRRSGQDPFRSYLSSITRVPPLSRHEEHELALHARAGDAAARQKIIRHNLALVVSVVRRFSLGSVRLDDVIQEGNLGLLRATERFDPDAGTRFATYAVWWIRAYVAKYLQEARSIVRPPSGSWASSDLSLDSAVAADDDTTYMDRVEDERPGPELALQSLEGNREVREILERCRVGFGAIGWDIIQSRLQREEPHSLEKIGERWGLSRERVRQIELRLKKQLARCLGESVAA